MKRFPLLSNAWEKANGGRGRMRGEMNREHMEGGPKGQCARRKISKKDIGGKREALPRRGRGSGDISHYQENYWDVRLIWRYILIYIFIGAPRTQPRRKRDFLLGNRGKNCRAFPRFVKSE